MSLRVSSRGVLCKLVSVILKEPKRLKNLTCRSARFFAALRACFELLPLPCSAAEQGEGWAHPALSHRERTSRQISQFQNTF